MFSTRRSLIDKANTTVLIAIAVAVFVVIFTFFAGRSLVTQLGYKNRVIGAKRTALNQLNADVTANNNLKVAYANFIGKPTNIIGGSTTGGNQNNNGNSAKIVLDALPSQYDPLELASSVTSLLQSQGVTVNSFTDPTTLVTQPGTATPAPIPIPVTFSVTGSYQNIQNLITAVANYIRPIQIQSLQMSGSQNQVTIGVTAQTYYQPEKIFQITSETIQ